MLVIGYNNKEKATNEQQQQQQNGSFTWTIAHISAQEVQLANRFQVVSSSDDHLWSSDDHWCLFQNEINSHHFKISKHFLLH